MARFAVKRLTESDLTFFKVHFDRASQTNKQKGINLNASPFVYEFFPALSELRQAFHFPIRILGPGSWEPHSLSRKAVRATGAKNWRLNGEFVVERDHEIGRYEPLQAGDFAVMQFDGGATPTGITMALVSQAEDQALYNAIDSELSLSQGRSMAEVQAADVEGWRNATAANYTEIHPLDALIVPDSPLDVLFGGHDTAGGLPFGDGKGARITPDELAGQLSSAGDLGLEGEELFAVKLENSGLSEGMDFEWTSRSYARASYDFLLLTEIWGLSGAPLYVDVKTTRGGWDRPFHVSIAELRWAANTNYFIARVSGVGIEVPRLRILSGLPKLASNLLAILSSELPAGVTVDSVRIDPQLLEVVHDSDLPLVMRAEGDE